MLSPFGLCWNQLVSATQVDEILKKATCIEEILDEENIINSIKQSENKFATFLKQNPQYFIQLVDYIIKEQQGNNPRQCFKYPLTVCEIFTSQNTSLINLFFENFEINESQEIKEGKQVLDHLMSFIYDQQKNLNQTLSSYFAKSIYAILNVQGVQFIKYVFEDKQDCLQNFLNKIDSLSICEIYFRILSIDIPNCQELNSFIDQRIKMINQIFELFQKDQDFEIQDNITQLLCDLFDKFQLVKDNQLIYENIYNESNFQIIIRKLQSKEQPQILNASKIIFSMMNYIVKIQKDDNKICQQFLKQIQYAIQVSKDILNQNQQQQMIDTTFGLKCVSFGQGNLKLIDIIDLGQKIQFQEQFYILDEKILSTLFVILFYQRILCNNFHLIIFYNKKLKKSQFPQLMEIIKSINKQYFILNQIFKNLKLIKIITDAMNNLDYMHENKVYAKIKKGFSSQFSNISNKINENSENEFIKNNFNFAWYEYRDGLLNQINTNNLTDIGSLKENQLENTQTEIIKDGDSTEVMINYLKKYEHLLQKNQDIIIENIEKDQLYIDSKCIDGKEIDTENNQEFDDESYFSHNYWKQQYYNLNDIIADLE